MAEPVLSMLENLLPGGNGGSRMLLPAIVRINRKLLILSVMGLQLMRDQRYPLYGSKVAPTASCSAFANCQILFD
jgi:hypothetical protein